MTTTKPTKTAEKEIHKPKKSAEKRRYRDLIEIEAELSGRFVPPIPSRMLTYSLVILGMRGAVSVMENMITTTLSSTMGNTLPPQTV